MLINCNHELSSPRICARSQKSGPSLPIRILHWERDFQCVIRFAIILSTNAPSVIIGKKQMTNSFNCIIAILISLRIDRARHCKNFIAWIPRSNRRHFVSFASTKKRAKKREGEREKERNKSGAEYPLPYKERQAACLNRERLLTPTIETRRFTHSYNEMDTLNSRVRTNTSRRGSFCTASRKRTTPWHTREKSAGAEGDGVISPHEETSKHRTLKGSAERYG